MQNGMLISVPEIGAERARPHPCRHSRSRRGSCARALPRAPRRQFFAQRERPVTGVWLKAHTGNGLKVTRRIAQSRPRPAARSAVASMRAKPRANPALPSNALGGARPSRRAASSAASQAVCGDDADLVAPFVGAVGEGLQKPPVNDDRIGERRRKTSARRAPSACRRRPRRRRAIERGGAKPAGVVGPAKACSNRPPAS